MGDELMHYGVKGQKWGVRRYQPYPDGSVNGKFIGRRKMARQAKRALNYNDKKMARAAYDLRISNARADRYMKKAQKVKSSIKRQKLLNKASIEKGDAKELTRRINEGKKVSQQIISSMGKLNFATQRDLTLRRVHEGKNIAASLGAALAAVSMAQVAGVGIGVSRQHQIEGVKYKVKDANKLSSRQIQKIGKRNARTNRLLEDMRDSRYYGTGKTSRRDQKLLNAKEKKIYDWNDKNNALKPDLAKSLSKAGLDDGDLQDINRAWQKANNASKKDFDGDSFTPSQEVRETRVFGKTLNPADRKKFNYYTAKIDKAENDYLNIAEDDFTPHDENYMKKYHAAEKKYEDAKNEYRKWRNTVSNRVF